MPYKQAMAAVVIASDDRALLLHLAFWPKAI